MHKTEESEQRKKRLTLTRSLVSQEAEEKNLRELFNKWRTWEVQPGSQDVKTASWEGEIKSGWRQSFMREELQPDKEP